MKHQAMSGIMIICLILINAAALFGQFTNQIFYFHPNGTTTGTLKTEQNNSVPQDINAYDVIKIQGRFYNKSDYPVILVARFIDPNNDQDVSYPISFVGKGEIKPFNVYGPLFYDGRESMSLELKVFVVKKDNDFTKVKGIYDTFYPDALEFIPVIGQATKFIDLGWKIAENFAPKDKTETFQTIQINREPTLMMNAQAPTYLRTRMQWQILANSDASKNLRDQMIQGFNVSSPDSIPDINLTEGRALFVSVVKASRAKTFEEISNGIDRFLKKNADRCTGSGFTCENPYQGDAVQAALSLRTFLEIYLSTVEVANATANNTDTSERPFVNLFNTFIQQQSSSGDIAGRGLFRLPPTYEKQAASILTNLMEYRNLDDSRATGENGFASIATWYRWLEKRCGKRLDTAACENGIKTMEFKQMKEKGGSPPRTVVVANTKYTQNYFNDILSKTTLESSKTTVERLQQMRKNVERIKELVSRVYRSTDEDPWLEYEKTAMASLLSDKFPTLPKLGINGEGKSDFPTYTKELEAVLNSSNIIIEPELDTSGKIKVLRIKTIPDYVEGAFVKDLVALARDNGIVDKHDGIKSKYVEIVVTPINEMLAPKEAEEVLKKITVFKAVDKLELTPGNYDDYFKKAVFDISVVGTRPIVTVNNDGNNIIQKVKALDDLFAPELDTFAASLNTPPKKDATLKLQANRKTAVGNLMNLVRPDLKFSVNIRAIDAFERRIADERLASLKPLTPLNIAAWKAQAVQSLTQAVNWDPDARRFYIGQSDTEVQQIFARLSVSCNRQNVSEIKDCPYPIVGVPEPTAEQSINRLYEIICDNTISSQKRRDAFDTLEEFIDILADKLTKTDEEAKCSLYKDEYPFTSLRWSSGMFRPKPAPTSSPTPSPVL